jgi:hypothetical protein
MVRIKCSRRPRPLRGVFGPGEPRCLDGIAAACLQAVTPMKSDSKVKRQSASSYKLTARRFEWSLLRAEYGLELTESATIKFLEYCVSVERR